MVLSIGEFVRNPYESFHRDPPPGGVWVHMGKGSRAWKLWDRQRVVVPKGSACIVIDTVMLEGHQWACVLVNGVTGWTSSCSLSRVGPRGGWKR